ncbi:MAG: efflux RND transporter periplasmic adaptor subunit [Proteobacteria bacterium]|jgi:membrane fusion protein (multidrug efflux system)|nr:efflux RND transporter periplasmic adaptor subunit [Pseudomonadota bacterium]
MRRTVSGLCILLLASVPVRATDNVDLFFNELPQEQASTSNQYRGQLRPVNYTLLSAGIDGILKSFPVKTGRQVKKDQIIAEFNCDVERADQEVGVARKQAASENLKVNQRLEELRSISNIDLSMSASELAIASAELDRTSARLAHCIVKAPFGGTITQKHVQAFQFVKTGDLLVEIVDTENLEVEMVLPSVNLQYYRPGTPFTLVVDETGDQVNAIVDRVVDVIDPVSQTIRIIGVLSDPPAGLMPGMSGVVSF